MQTKLKHNIKKSHVHRWLGVFTSLLSVTSETHILHKAHYLQSHFTPTFALFVFLSRLNVKVEQIIIKKNARTSQEWPSSTNTQWQSEDKGLKKKFLEQFTSSVTIERFRQPCSSFSIFSRGTKKKKPLGSSKGAEVWLEKIVTGFLPVGKDVSFASFLGRQLAAMKRWIEN